MNFERKNNVVTITDNNGKKIIMTWDECKLLLKLIYKEEWREKNEEMV